jgi:hypothetical protein
LKELETLGAKELVYIKGNHEARFDSYVASIAGILMSVFNGRLVDPKILGGNSTMFSIEWMVANHPRGTKKWKFVDRNSGYPLSDQRMAWAIHDGFGSGDSVPAQLEKRVQGKDVVFAHTHRGQSIIRGVFDDNSYQSISAFGWLGAPEAARDYAHEWKIKVDWPLGFGIGYVRPNGRIKLCPVPIEQMEDKKWSCILEGKEYRIS